MLLLRLKNTQDKVMMTKRYSELIKLPTLRERFNYLRLKGSVGEATFGVDRYLNQILYSSTRWKTFRRKIIIRDNGCELALEDNEIVDKVYIHHMNPITIQDVETNSSLIFDPENVVCCSFAMHNAIHFGTDPFVINRFVPVERKPNDTCLWK